MRFARFQPRVSFQAKVLVPVVSVMVLLMAVTIWLVNHRISEQLHERAAQQLETASSLFRELEDLRSRDLLARYRNAFKEPRFKAVVQLEDAPTTREYLSTLIKEELGHDKEELGHDDGATLVTCTFARAGEPRFVSANRDPLIDVEEFQARSAAVINQAFAGPTVDTVSVGGRLLDVVSIPVSGVGDQTVGVCTIGVEIGAQTTREIKRITRSEILFVNEGRVVATSLPQPELYPQLAAQFNELSSGLAPRGDRSTRQILLNGQHYLCRAGRLAPLGVDHQLGYLLLSSYEPSFLGLRATQQLLMLAGLFGILLGTAGVWFLIGKVTQPLRQLRDSAEAVGRGDFSKRVEVASRDECGELASVFNQMTENLQTSRQELEKTVETLKTTQSQLIQSEKLSGIGEFVAGVAHELNNPLTSVMGFAELLQQTDMAEPQRRHLDMIAKSAKRCTKIVQSLLSFARRHAPERKVVCLNEIVESAVEILQYQMRTGNIEMQTRLDPRLPATEVDPHQMQQVFLNLINNARQAIEAHQPGGWLKISTESSQGRVRAIFQDNGPGIPAENLKKVFNPFFTTKEVGKGTGLGLSLCYGIVSEHGGTITPQSAPGAGATFVVELPVAPTAAAVAEKPAAPEPARSPREGVGKRILVIDDEDAILQMIREVLTLNGYRVDVARDGESALRRLGQYHYDLALCDWKMPGLGGRQVYEHLQASNPDMTHRLIFITGDVVNENTQEFLRDRNKVCLSKPFTLLEFRSAIGRVLNPAS